MSVRKWILTALIFTFGFAAVACQTTTTVDEIGYEDFDSIERFDQIWTRRDAGGDYIIYLYGSSCSSCNAIKDDILEFVQTYTDKHVYFFDISDFLSTDAEVVNYFTGITGIADLSYPALLIVKNQTFDKTAKNRYYYAGESRILPVLYDLEQGIFPYWD